MTRVISTIFILLLAICSVSAQKDQFKAVSVGFYNLENLFDFERDTTIRDSEFTPWGKRAWTEEKYKEKLANMAYVISQMGIDVTPAGLSILGVSEIENKRVLEDLVKQESIADRNYQIVHRDSPDRRGIDVAMIYNPSHFKVLNVKMENINYIFDDGDTLRTREIMHVEGVLDGDTTHVLVNHWPSRSGGEKRSAPRRNKAAQTCKMIVDSLKAVNPNVKVLVMGDFNDDPTSTSTKGILKAKGKKKDVGERDMFNPMHDYYRRGLGSNAYRDNWSLFDQIILSPGLLDQEQDGYFYYRAIIFNKKYLIQRSGQYKGYPYRTFSGDKYQGGYSDHFPVFVYLVKKV
ncbi:MAG: endonuclease/exonuclease/phosphatase family protein [Saprospiraceae bacterium]|nr:endonuclease/exonuclease/phosphatase family protein [Saprospiraceae bacterium]